MSQTVRRAATLLSALTLTIVAFAAPAQAATQTAATAVAPRALGDCPSSYACLWPLTDGQGSRWQGQNWNSTLPSYIDNNSWSSYNHGVNCTVHFWTGAGYTGVPMNEGIGSRRADLRQNPRPDGGNWADVISSVSWC